MSGKQRYRTEPVAEGAPIVRDANQAMSTHFAINTRTCVRSGIQAGTDKGLPNSSRPKAVPKYGGYVQEGMSGNRRLAIGRTAHLAQNAQRKPRRMRFGFIVS